MLMKLGPKGRRVAAPSSMKTLHWSIDRDAGLRGSPGIFMNESLVASCYTSMQSCCGKTRLCVGKSDLPENLQCGSSVKSILMNFENAQCVVLILTIFYKISQENILRSSVTIKSLILAWVNECQCTFTHLLWRKTA